MPPTRARSIAVLLAMMLVVVACKSRSETPPAAEADVKKKIAPDDCKQWSTHAVDVILRDWKGAASQCPADARTALANKLDGERPSIERNANEICSRHVGEQYVTKDGLCYAAATTVDGLAACNFAVMASPGDTDLKAALEDLRRKCASRAAPSSGISL